MKKRNNNIELGLKLLMMQIASNQVKRVCDLKLMDKYIEDNNLQDKIKYDSDGRPDSFIMQSTLKEIHEIEVRLEFSGSGASMRRIVNITWDTEDEDKANNYVDILAKKEEGTLFRIDRAYYNTKASDGRIRRRDMRLEIVTEGAEKAHILIPGASWNNDMSLIVPLKSASNRDTFKGLCSRNPEECMTATQFEEVKYELGRNMKITNVTNSNEEPHLTIIGNSGWFIEAVFKVRDKNGKIKLMKMEETTFLVDYLDLIPKLTSRKFNKVEQTKTESSVEKIKNKKAKQNTIDNFVDLVYELAEINTIEKALQQRMVRVIKAFDEKEVDSNWKLDIQQEGILLETNGKLERLEDLKEQGIDVDKLEKVYELTAKKQMEVLKMQQMELDAEGDE